MQQVTSWKHAGSEGRAGEQSARIQDGPLILTTPAVRTRTEPGPSGEDGRGQQELEPRGRGMPSDSHRRGLAVPSVLRAVMCSLLCCPHSSKASAWTGVSTLSTAPHSGTPLSLSSLSLCSEFLSFKLNQDAQVLCFF